MKILDSASEAVDPMAAEGPFIQCIRMSLMLSHLVSLEVLSRGCRWKHDVDFFFLQLKQVLQYLWSLALPHSLNYRKRKKSAYTFSVYERTVLFRIQPEKKGCLATCFFFRSRFEAEGETASDSSHSPSSQAHASQIKSLWIQLLVTWGNSLTESHEASNSCHLYFLSSTIDEVKHIISR